MAVEFILTDDEKASYREFSCRVNLEAGRFELLGSRTIGSAAKFEFIRAIEIPPKVEFAL